MPYPATGAAALRTASAGLPSEGGPAGPAAVAPQVSRHPAARREADRTFAAHHRPRLRDRGAVVNAVTRRCYGRPLTGS
jgi:hypothetical protein